MRHFVLVILLLSSSPIFAQTPAELWDDLKKGNDFYTATHVSDMDLRVQRRRMETARKETATKQKPLVTILSCSDSRVPPELVFSKTIGELFVVRTAGNIAGTLDIGSIEYALLPHKPDLQPWTRLIVVLAHEHCGAVEAALDPANTDKTLPPGVYAIVEQVRRSFAAIPGWHRGNATVKAATIANARYSANDLMTRSSLINDAVRNRGLEIYVAYYTLSNGQVELIK